MFATYKMYSKTEEFSIADNKLASAFKALSHPARVAIIRHLSQSKTCISGDIAEVIPLSRSTVSQHLSALKQADLIQGTIDGQKICYCLNREVWTQIKPILEAFFPSENSFNMNANGC